LDCNLFAITDDGSKYKLFFPAIIAHHSTFLILFAIKLLILFTKLSTNSSVLPDGNNVTTALYMFFNALILAAKQAGARVFVLFMGTKDAARHNSNVFI
jgi:hypothetical protein